MRCLNNKATTDADEINCCGLLVLGMMGMKRVLTYLWEYVQGIHEVIEKIYLEKIEDSVH